ncbi:hypothetical protein PMNALOAF_3615 [Methylobacterium adhaesivum]|uniref:CobQ/CobB/MinD/ParA nucleotide binding domain-containing protein n=1 Tax=Methylobacterium adhaesivum TaxID=333297 RepID=A0ABT8BIB9_9HYPH|nr:hypothetical protein [Methylobacterium adhaesivum]MDN3591897.1 hypothetical protein [Methylobacterium adhaesivum]GJD32346.1 hypothetical protein PMNALOAF_3615 [Methylobacterium adhaesivum]
MNGHVPIPIEPLYATTERISIRDQLLSSVFERCLFLCLGGKGGAGKTNVAIQITDLCAEVADVLAIDADLANEHFFTALMRPTVPKSEQFVPRQPGIDAIKHRLRAEDHAGRIDTTACQDLMGVVADARQTFTVIDFPAGDTATTQRCAEIIVETCKECGIRLVPVVVVGAIDPTPLQVLTDLWPLLKACDRAVVAKNTAQTLNFDFLEESEIFGRLQGLPNFRVTEIDKIGERLLEGLRIGNILWRELATTTPMRIRVEARRLRREFHAAWREAFRP